jgi:hypothetical protein
MRVEAHQEERGQRPRARRRYYDDKYGEQRALSYMVDESSLTMHTNKVHHVTTIGRVAPVAASIAAIPGCRPLLVQP